MPTTHTTETKNTNLIARNGLLFEHFYAMSCDLTVPIPEGIWGKKNNNNKYTHTQNQKCTKPWRNPLGKVDDEFRCSASAVRITKLWAQCRIIWVQTWVGLRVHTRLCQSRAKTVSSSGVGRRKHQYEESTWLVLFSDQWEWLRVEHLHAWISSKMGMCTVDKAHAPSA